LYPETAISTANRSTGQKISEEISKVQVQKKEKFLKMEREFIWARTDKIPTYLNLNF